MCCGDVQPMQWPQPATTLVDTAPSRCLGGQALLIEKRSAAQATEADAMVEEAEQQ